jgi:hypothetical protein
VYHIRFKTSLTMLVLAGRRWQQQNLKYVRGALMNLDPNTYGCCFNWCLSWFIVLFQSVDTHFSSISYILENKPPCHMLDCIPENLLKPNKQFQIEIRGRGLPPPLVFGGSIPNGFLGKRGKGGAKLDRGRNRATGTIDQSMGSRKLSTSQNPDKFRTQRPPILQQCLQSSTRC